METLILPFQFPFMQNAFLIAAIISVPAALLSCFLVLRGWALMGDAISHAVLPGIVVAYVLGAPMLLGAFIAGLFCGVATGFVKENSRIKYDTAMGVIFSGLFGLGIVLWVQVTPGQHLDHIMFGNILGVSRGDLLSTLAIAVTVSVVLLVFWRDLMIESFDSVQAQAQGLPVRVLYYGLLVAIALVVVAALSAVGIILSIGLLVAPGGIAFLVTRRFHHMMIVSVLVCLSGSVLGVYASFFLDSAPAPTIILVLSLIFVGVFSVSVLRANQRAKQVLQQ